MDDLLQFEPSFYTADVTGDDIAIFVDYKPWYWPITRTHKQRFVAAKQSNNKFYWDSAPADGNRVPLMLATRVLLIVTGLFSGTYVGTDDKYKQKCTL